MARSEFSKIRAGGVTAMLLVVATSVGCQSDYAGQTLPSPYWQKDDIQYFPPGPEFKLSREAAAMKAYGTGRASRPAAAPIGPAEAGPRPGGDLDQPATVVQPPPGAGPAPLNGAAAPPAADAMPPDEAPAGEAPADNDPFNPQ